MKKLGIVLLAILAGGTTRLMAQAEGSDYKTAVGVAYYPGSITVKHFIQEDKALEGQLAFWTYGFRFTGFYEIHRNIPDAPGLKWFIGPGAHVGGWNGNWQHDYPYRAQGVTVGVDGITGLDYKFNGAPLNLSIYIQPGLNVVDYVYVNLWGGLAFRFAF